MWHLRPLAVKVPEQIVQGTQGREREELDVAIVTKNFRERGIV